MKEKIYLFYSFIYNISSYTFFRIITNNSDIILFDRIRFSYSKQEKKYSVDYYLENKKVPPSYSFVLLNKHQELKLNQVSWESIEKIYNFSIDTGRKDLGYKLIKRKFFHYCLL